VSYPVETDEHGDAIPPEPATPKYPPLWALFNPLFRCPKCGNTTFRLLTTITVSDTLILDEETGKASLELAESSQLTEGLDPFDCDEAECDECDEPIDKTQLFRHIDRKTVEYEW